jgi:hypothetical protein
MATAVASGRSRSALSAMITASTTSEGTKDFTRSLDQSDVRGAMGDNQRKPGEVGCPE